MPIAVDPGWTPPPYVPVEEEDEKPRRRALVAVPVVMALVAAIAAGSWWLGRDDNAAQADAKPSKAGQSAGQNKGNAKPTKKPSSSSPKPTPSKTPQVVIKSNKPTVATLKSDLAFDKGSAVLSDAAKAAIAQIADAVREAGLKGTIAVHGYTDNVGSAKSGMELSKLRRAGGRAVPARRARRLHDRHHARSGTARTTPSPATTPRPAGSRTAGSPSSCRSLRSPDTA